MEETDFIAFLNIYGKTILDMLDLKGREIHENVMNSIEKFLKSGYENLPATVCITLRKNKHLLEEMMYLTDDEKQMAKKKMANMMMRMMT